MAFDFSNISDEELEAMAAQSAPASGFGGAAPSAPQKPLSEWTDEELEAYASEPTPAPAQSAANPPRMTREERIAANNRAIETARSQENPGFLSSVGDAIAEGAKGAARAVKSIGSGIVGMASGAVRLAGTPVRLATGWEGLHRLADTIDSSYENFGRDALMSEYGENPDGWGYALGRAGEKVAGVAGSLAALGGVGKAVGAAGTALKAAGHAKTAAAVANTLPLMFGNDAAVRAYDTARANGKSKGESAALAGLNGAIHFLGFKAFENQSLKKMLNIGPEVEVMMPKWANALADAGGQSFSSLVRGTRNGMVKYIAAENGKRALKAGGIMGLQDMLSDPVMQVAEGADIDDIDFSRMLKAGAHGVGEGVLMEGLTGGAAIYKSQKAAEKFIADKYFRGKDYKVIGADGKPHDEPGLLNSSEGRMMLMKQNPDATERVLDIVEHGGTPRPAELDAAFLPPDMTAEELKKFASDWRNDLKPYVDEAWAADAPRQTPAPDAASAKPGRDMLSPEEAQSQQKVANDAAERQKLADRRAAADSMMLDFESWNRLYADGKTDLNFDEWRAAGKPGVIEANLTPKTEEAPTSETRTDEAPARSEQTEVVAPPAGAEARPVESAEAPAEAPDARVVAQPAVWPNGWDNAGEEIKGYVVPNDSDVAQGREVAIAHRSGGSINAPQKIKGVVESVDGDKVKVYYRDGMGYDQHDTFRKSELVGVMPLTAVPTEGATSQTAQNRAGVAQERAGARPASETATTTPAPAKPAEAASRASGAEPVPDGKPSSDRDYLSKTADRLNYDEVIDTDTHSNSDMRAEYKARIGELTDEQARELADARRKERTADKKLEELLKGNDGDAIDAADKEWDAAVVELQSVESKLKITESDLIDRIEAKKTPPQKSVPDGKGKMVKPKATESDYGVTMFEEPAVDGEGVSYVVKDGPSDAHRMMFKSKAEAEARLAELRAERKAIKESPSATLADGKKVRLLKTDEGWIPYDENYNDLRHGMFKAAKTKAEAVKIAEKGVKWAKGVAEENARYEAEAAKPSPSATWTDSGGTTHKLDGFDPPSADNITKGRTVAIRHDNGVLYSGELVGIGPKNVKIKTQSDMYGEQVLTFPKADVVGVKSNRLRRVDGTDPLAENPMPKTVRKAVDRISLAIGNRTGTGAITPEEADGIVRGIAESPETKHNRYRDFFNPLVNDAKWHESLGLDAESAKNVRDAVDRVKTDADLKKWFPQVDSAVKKAKDGKLSRADAVPLFGKISEGLEKAERMGLSEAANRLREAAEVIRPVAEEVTQGDVGKFNYSTKGRKLNNRLGGTDKRGGKTVSLDTKNGTVDVGADGKTLDEVIDEGADASHDRRSLKPGESYGKGFTGEERDAGGEVVEAPTPREEVDVQDRSVGNRRIKIETEKGETNVVWRNDMGDVVRRAPLDTLEKAAKKDPAIKDLIEKLKQGEQIRASKSAESPAERDLRFASDENYQKWLKSRKANDAEPLRERYEQEQAKAAKSITKNALPGVDVEIVDRAFNPETDGGNRQLLDGEGRVVGTFDRSTNKVKLYRGASATTLVHELGGHATLRFAEQEAERGNRQLLDRINRAIDEAPQALKDEIRSRYPRVDETALRDEIWAALRERNSPAMEKAIKTLQGKAWYNRAWSAFRDAWKGLLARMGFNRADLSQIDKMSNDEFLSHLDRIMSDGKTLGRLEAMGEGTRNAVVSSKPPPTAPKINMSKDESLKEKYLRNMSDRYDPLKRLVEEAKESATKPSDVPDPYHEKRVQSGHNEADRHQIDMLKNKYVDFLKRHSHGQKEQEKLHEEVNMYLRARDALYRNPEMKKRLGVDDGSGMSDAQAHKILDDFKRRMRTPILDQAFKIMQEVKKTYGLQRLVDGGMLDQATADMLEKRNPDYAPQRTSRLDEEGIDRNSTRNMEAAAIKKALGRSTLSDNPVEFLFLQASDAAARTNENRTRQEMAKFVRMFPEVGKVRTVDKTSAYDLKTGKDAWIEDPHDVESENPLVVSFRENGKRMRIEFADTPRGRLLAESMRNEGVNRGPEAFDRMTRAWASTATQLSATFSGRNFQKDTVEVALNSAADTGFSGAGKFLKAQIAQMKPVVSTIREYLTKGTFGGPLGKELKEFIDAGGSIGGMGREGYEDLKDTFSRKAKGLKMAFSGAHGVKEKVEAILGVTFGKIEDFNKTIEMMSRFNNYRSRRAKGESKKEAVIGSREDSTDFNMYGQQRWLNDVYMFSNSILGGTLRSTKQLATGKNGLKVATAVLAYGFVEAAADVLFNQDDDDEAEKSGLGGAKDLSERERSQTLYFRYGGKYFRIPVHGGPFSALKYTGGLLARAMLGKLSWSDAAKNAGKEWATIGTHFGGAGEIDLTNGPKGIVSSFTPSVARPVAELGMNQDFAGRHIYAPEGFDRTTPKSERGFKSTGDGYKWFARLMNKVGGGNESRSADWSWFDNPPEAYKHIVEAVGKNMVRDIMLGGETAGRAVESVANWENRFTRDDVPFLRDVTRNVPDNSRRYYDALEDYERDKAEFKKTTPERRREMKADKPYLFVGKSLLDGQIERVKKYMHLERGEVKVGQKWVEPKTPRTEAQKEEWRKKRLALQAQILERLGK